MLTVLARRWLSVCQTSGVGKMCLMTRNIHRLGATGGDFRDADGTLLQVKIMNIANWLHKELPVLRRHDARTAADAISLVATARQLARTNKLAESNATLSECQEMLQKARRRREESRSPVTPLLTQMPRK
jgi:hypothetical protein